MLPSDADPRAYVVLTGQCQGRRHLIVIAHQPVWLPGSQFRALCQLIAARLNQSNGFVELKAGDVCGLRRVLERSTVEWPTAPFSISTGAGETYALLGNLDFLAIDGTFPALAEGRTLPRRLVECIRRHCRPVD